jgi:hypothetical protein
MCLVTEPEFVEAVVGFRVWDVERDRLLTRTAGIEWLPGTNTARCFGHRACPSIPGAGCGCGLHATVEPATDVDDMIVFGGRAVGAVAAWGRLAEEPGGFRAEQAKVVALAHPPRAASAVITRLASVAAHYRVPLVALGDLAEAAAEHGAAWQPLRSRPVRSRGALGRGARRGGDTRYPPAAAGGIAPVDGWQRRVVAPTAAVRRLTRDQVYLHVGSYERTLFHLRVFEASGHPAVVIAGNLDGRSGRSVTNAAAPLAGEIAARVLPGESFAFLEHYPHGRADPIVAAERSFTPVTFDANGRAAWGPALTQDAVEALVGQVVVVFPAGHYTASNVEHVRSAEHAQVAADSLAPACPEHGRTTYEYCSQGSMACYVRHARAQRRFGPRVPAARAQLPGGRYEGQWLEDAGADKEQGSVSVVVGGRSRLNAPAGSGGFGWGYGGGGAHDLARAILTDWHGHAVAPALIGDFVDEVIRGLPEDRFTLRFEQVARWLHAPAASTSRGLVFVASAAVDPGGPGWSHHVGSQIADALQQAGFETYLPEHALVGARGDAVHPAVILSHRGALARASAIVVPCGLPDTAPPCVEAALALDHARLESETLLVVAALDEAVELAGDHFGLMGAEVSPTPQRSDLLEGRMVPAGVRALVELAADLRAM